MKRVTFFFKSGQRLELLMHDIKIGWDRFGHIVGLEYTHPNDKQKLEYVNVNAVEAITVEPLEGNAVLTQTTEESMPVNERSS